MKKDRSFANALIVNPKRYADAGGAQDARLFPYYAGYSAAFASNLLASLAFVKDPWILDPWNGGGITTHTARRFGYRAIGRDLNPVMVLIAKAELLSPQDVGSLIPLAHTILDGARRRNERFTEDDPLCRWLAPSTASFIRAIETEINSSLVSHKKYRQLSSASDFDEVSSLAAFFYVVLFRVSRRLLNRFKPTNPMWTKSPTKPHQRTKAGRRKVASMFLDEVRPLSALVAVHSFLVTDEMLTCDIGLGNSEKLQLKSRSIDMVLTSPPYCTRIDYAMATAIELAVLRFSKIEFDKLRRSLMGTSTVTADEIEKHASWGKTCNRFLDKLYTHSSKASKTYYFKNHLQYFQSLYLSIGEISRVLKRDGKCVIVMQDSYYKDIRNDVPKIVGEMANSHGLLLRRQEKFVSNRSMVGMNKKAREYVARRKIKESVLCFVQS
jgi:DNA modification methylase